MKQPSHTKLHLVPPRMITLIAAAAMALAVPASADVTVTFTNSGTSVVASFSGSVDTTVLGPPTVASGLFVTPNITPTRGWLSVGGNIKYWNNVMFNRSGGAGGPNGYGTAEYAGGNQLHQGGGPFSFAAAGSGGTISVSSGYTSGNMLSGTLTYPNMTVAGLGIVNTVYTFGGGQRIIIVNGTAVPDAAPIANAGVDFSVNEGQTGVALNGSLSSDPDGDPLAYAWTQVSGGTAVTLTGAGTASPTFTAPVVAPGGGTLSFDLTVTANGKTSTDTVSVTVVNVNVNRPPVADAGADQSIREVRSRQIAEGTRRQRDRAAIEATALREQVRQREEVAGISDHIAEVDTAAGQTAIGIEISRIGQCGKRRTGAGMAKKQRRTRLLHGHVDAENGCVAGAGQSLDIALQVDD